MNTKSKVADLKKWLDPYKEKILELRAKLILEEPVTSPANREFVDDYLTDMLGWGHKQAMEILKESCAGLSMYRRLKQLEPEVELPADLIEEMQVALSLENEQGDKRAKVILNVLPC